MVRRTELRTDAYGQFLYCPSCDSRYSATKGDYFWMPDDEPFTCQDDGTPLVLAVSESRVVVVLQ